MGSRATPTLGTVWCSWLLVFQATFPIDLFGLRPMSLYAMPRSASRSAPRVQRGRISIRAQSRLNRLYPLPF